VLCGAATAAGALLAGCTTGADGLGGTGGDHTVSMAPMGEG
jgi:hypothetical protein